MATVLEGTKIDTIRERLGKDAALLDHTCKTVPRDRLSLPGPDFIDRVFIASDRPVQVNRSFQSLLGHGRLAGTGYVSILPVDQGIEHSAGASFAPNPLYFDPANVVRLAIEGGCNAVASTLGVLGAVSRRFAHRIPFLVKLNHNELLTYPALHDQTMVASVRQAFDLGAVAVGATIYWGTLESRRQLQEVAAAFAQAHELGMFTVLWCYLRNAAFKTKTADHHVAADLTGQANHLGVTLEKSQLNSSLAQLRALKNELAHQAYHDSLTGLANRVLFRERVTAGLEHVAASGSGLAVLFIDLDDFKTVNDTMGHAAGDTLLRELLRQEDQHAPAPDEPPAER